MRLAISESGASQYGKRDGRRHAETLAVGSETLKIDPEKRYCIVSRFQGGLALEEAVFSQKAVHE
jgi:hypothetical protein